jgi:hypothetical protein
MFSTTLCLASTSHPATTIAGHHAAGQEPLDDELLRVDPDCLESAVRERHEDTAAEGDEYEIDGPLAAEPNEVHTQSGRTPVVAYISQADREPQGDGEMNAGENHRLRGVGQAIGVGRHGPEREQRHQRLDQRVSGPTAPS